MKYPFLLTTSWDDGSPYDKKLAELLYTYSIPATFYISVKNHERAVMSARDIANLARYYEIGAHTVTHRDLTKLSEKEMIKEISEGKRRLEDIVGREITSFCYPKGKVNAQVKQIVGQLGFRYARTTRLFTNTLGDRLLAPTTAHVYDHQPLLYMSHGFGRKLFYQIARKSLSFKWDDLAMASLDYCLEHGGIFHLWGHAWEIEERHDWARLERFFAYIAEKTKKQERGTNGAILSHFEKQKKLYYEQADARVLHASQSSFYFRQEQQFLQTFVKPYDRRGSHILDLGCGSGRLSELFQNAEYQGIDFAKNLIAFAKKEYPEKNKTFLLTDLEKGLAHALPKQDLILVWGLFEDEPDPFGRVRELTQLVKKGTRIIFSLHNVDNHFFRAGHYLKSELSGHMFPYTTFTQSFVSQQAQLFAEKHGYSWHVTSFGMLPPIGKKSRGLRGFGPGATLVVILDKL